MKIIYEIAIGPWNSGRWRPFPPDEPISSNGDRIIDVRWRNDKNEIAYGRLAWADDGLIVFQNSDEKLLYGYKYIDKNRRYCIKGDLSLWEIEELFGWSSPELLT